MRLPLACVIVLCATEMPAASGPTVSIAATARIGERTSLSASTDVLVFTVPDGASEASASLDFRVGVRAMPGRDVLLVAEVSGLRTQGPRAVDSPVLRVRGEDDSPTAGVLEMSSRDVVARWSGGGLRHGTLTFTLRGAAPGSYEVPIRLFVTVP